MAVEPIATYVLIAINVASSSAPAASVQAPTSDLRRCYGPRRWPRASAGGCSPPASCTTEIWHIALNMLALFWLGRMIEPALGHARFVGDLLRLAAVRARWA